MSTGMLARIFTVARREYTHHARSKGFWLTMVAVPIVAVLGALVPQWLQENKPVRAFVLVDQSGGAIGREIDNAILRDTEKRQLIALKDYASTHIPGETLATLLDSPLGPKAGPITGADVAAFSNWGGLEKAREILPSLVVEDAPPLIDPGPRFVIVPLPEEIDPAAAPTVIGEALKPYLRFERPVQAGEPRYLFSAVIVPPDYSLTRLSAAIQYWSVNIADRDLEGVIEPALTQAAKRALYQDLGVSAEAVAAVEARNVKMQAFSPDLGDAGGAVSQRDKLLSMVPLALAVLLWLSIFTVANLLLLGVIEERSNRLIEVILSSVSAEEFMAGKLLGIAGIGLTILAVWLGAGLIGLANASGPFAEIGQNVVKMVVEGPYIPAFAFYFVVGYLMIASVFLGLGSICNTQQEAQSLLTPLVFILMFPFFIIVPLLEDPNGPLASTIGWIPLYTPFVMIFRLASNPPWYEVVATGLICLAFALLTLWAMSRLFRSAILRTGQPPRLIEVWRMMTRKET